MMDWDRALEAAAAAADEASESQLQTLVLLCMYTIAPPARCSIVRLLEWDTTLVKSTTDPTRYVIDLRNNPDAAASKHKTVKHYRRGILPLPCMLTAHIDRLRQLRFTPSRRSSVRTRRAQDTPVAAAAAHGSNWVFLNTRRASYTSSE